MRQPQQLRQSRLSGGDRPRAIGRHTAHISDWGNPRAIGRHTAHISDWGNPRVSVKHCDSRASTAPAVPKKGRPKGPDPV